MERRFILTGFLMLLFLFGFCSGAHAEEPPTILDSTLATEESIETSVYDPDEWKKWAVPWVLEGDVDGQGIWDVLEKVNAHRATYGNAPLVLDAKMTEKAMLRAAEIGVYFYHDRPALWSEGITTSSSENIVVGAMSANSCFNAWKKSPMHNDTLISSWAEYCGIGVFEGNWCMIFDDETRVDIEGVIPMTEEDARSWTAEDKRVQIRVNEDQMCTDIRLLQNQDLNMDQGNKFAAPILVYPHSGANEYKSSCVKVAGDTVTWTTTDPSIAKVDPNGVITAMRTGTAVVRGEIYGHAREFNITVSDRGTPQYPELTDYAIKYRTHVQNVGWQGFVADGSMSGTKGKSLRLEGINIELGEGVQGGVEYTTHVQNIGWQNKVSDGVMAGTEGRGLRLEGIRINLTGEAAELYDVYYRTHVQNIGWMNWAMNGADSGSAGFGWRLEGIEIQLVPKGEQSPSVSQLDSELAFVES